MPAPAAAPAGDSVMREELSFEDALAYVSKVQLEFKDRPHIYKEFMKILQKYQAKEIDIPRVIMRVSDLFRGNNNLILGMNTFLPDGFQISIKDLVEGGRYASKKRLPPGDIIKENNLAERSIIQSLESQLSKQTEKIKQTNEDILELKQKIKEQADDITKFEKENCILRSEVKMLRKEYDSIFSVKLLEEEIKCCICSNKFSTDINSTEEEIRQFLPVLSLAACPHYFCQGCVERSQIAAAEHAPQNKLPKWLKCMICKQNTAFCPENPFYHIKLIELLERAHRCHPIGVKVEEGQTDVETSSNSNDSRLSKRPKVTNIKEEM